MKWVMITICMVIAIAIAAVVTISSNTNDPYYKHDLGEDLLVAAYRHDWDKVKSLLAQGAEPNVTQIDAARLEPPRPHPLFPWLNSFLTRGLISPPSPPARKATLPTALQQAIEQRNMKAVRLMLSYPAARDPRDVEAAHFKGDREIMTLIDDTYQVPPGKRGIAQVPFAPGAREAQAEHILNTVGVFPSRHLLWLSPDEILLLRKDPWRFFSIDIHTGAVKDLPDLTGKWTNQALFDPEMLSLSPDGKWLLGFAGAADQPIWLATEINGPGLQQWDRPKDTGDKFFAKKPLIAWRDSARWLEIFREPDRQYVVRTHAIDNPAVEEIPLRNTGYNIGGSYPDDIFKFTDPDHAAIYGPAFIGSRGVAGRRMMTWSTAIFPGQTGWQGDNSEISVDASEMPGAFRRCIPSPDGKRLAWLNYFSISSDVDFLLSDSTGNHLRIAYEHIGPVRAGSIPGPDWEPPWHEFLEWSPRGDALLFWRGRRGEQGLAVVPISAEE